MRINLWAGPGAGKSTVAEGVSHNLKKKAYNVDLVREVIKEWAYLKRVPVSFEQAFITVSQIYQEDFLLNRGVEHVVTDSPVLMSVCYCKRYGGVYWPELLSLSMKFEEKYPSLNIFLSREGIPYKQNGRYEDWEAALAMDRMMKDFMDENDVPFFTVPSIDLDAITGVVEDHLNGVRSTRRIGSGRSH